VCECVSAHTHVCVQERDFRGCRDLRVAGLQQRSKPAAQGRGAALAQLV